MTLDIDLYRPVKCHDCGHIWLISGSTAVVLIQCPKCNSKNWDALKPLQK